MGAVDGAGVGSLVGLSVGCGVGAFDGLGVGDWNEISRAMERKNGVYIRNLNVCVGKEIIR